MTFGEVLKLEREKKGLTQEQLAEKLGYSRSKIGMYENGKREPGLEEIDAFCDFFNIDANYLLGKSDVRRKVWYDEFGNEYIPSDGLYYLDPESERLATEIHNDPNLRILMSTVRKVPPEDIEALITIAKRLEGKQEEK